MLRPGLNRAWLPGDTGNSIFGSSGLLVGGGLAPFIRNLGHLVGGGAVPHVRNLGLHLVDEGPAPLVLNATSG